MYSGSTYTYLVKSYEHIKDMTPFEYIEKMAPNDIMDIVDFIVNCYAGDNDVNSEIFNKMCVDLYEYSLSSERHRETNHVAIPDGYFRDALDYYNEYVAFMESDYGDFDELQQHVNKFGSKLEELGYSENSKYTILFTSLFLKIF